MKVTALIPDDLALEVKHLTQGKNIAESLVKALSEWVSTQKIKTLNSKNSKKPLALKRVFPLIFVEILIGSYCNRNV